MTIIDDILERYYTNLRQWAIPADLVALKAVTESLQSYGYVVTTKSLYRELSERPVRENTEETTQ